MGSGKSDYTIGKGGKGTSGSKDDGFRKVKGHTTRLHRDAQGKHIPGHKNYVPDAGRSIFKGSLQDAQELVSQFAGTGYWPTSNKEVVDFGKTIGTWVDGASGVRLPTSRGTIHYGKHGTHIVPANPNRKR